MRIFLGLFFCLCCVNALKILCIFPSPGHSHYTTGFILMKQLAQRGHNVTFVAPYKEKEPIENFRTIHLTNVADEWKEMVKDQTPMKQVQRTAFTTTIFIGFMGSIIVEKTLSHENMQNLLKSEEEFDIVIVELFASEGLLAVANHFNAPSVFVSALPPSPMSNHLFGNPDLPSYMTNILLEPPVHISFCRRLHNFVLYVFQRLFSHFYYFPKQNELIQKYFPNAPHVYDIIYNVSLILYNSDESYSQLVPVLPNMVSIGGYHVEPPKKLPEDLQNILDNAENGVIYFSMGSIIKTKDIPETIRKNILDVLSQFKETILWKFEEDLSEKPSNVIIRKWFPQSDILAHRNVKLFITHGGLLSTIEALSRGVPVVGIPVFGDQKTNMLNAVSRGQGVMVPFGELTKEKLSESLKEVLNNPKYSENAKLSSRILQDHVVKPIDKAEFWLEYIVRHKGAKHLRSVALDLTWYQHASFDVILFLIGVTAILFFVFYVIVKKLLCRKKTPKIKSN